MLSQPTNTQKDINLFRRPGLEKKTALSRSSIYMRIADGTLPPPISIGGRAVAWVESEIDAVNAARIAGKSDQEIRELIKETVAARKLFV